MNKRDYFSRKTVNSMGVHEYQVSFNGQMGIGATLHDAQVDAGVI